MDKQLTYKVISHIQHRGIWVTKFKGEDGGLFIGIGYGSKTAMIPVELFDDLRYVLEVASSLFDRNE